MVTVLFLEEMLHQRDQRAGNEKNGYDLAKIPGRLLVAAGMVQDPVEQDDFLGAPAERYDKPEDLFYWCVSSKNDLRVSQARHLHPMPWTS